MGVCRARALIRSSLPQVWEFLIKPGNMHLWGPYTEPVTGINRPFEAGDRVTVSRKDFLRRRRQTLLVEEVTPYQSLCLRDLSPGAVRLNVTAIVSVEAAADGEATWIEEAILYSLGKSSVLQWLDKALVNPVFQILAAFGTQKAFLRMQASLEQPHTPGSTY